MNYYLLEYLLWRGGRLRFDIGIQTVWQEGWGEDRTRWLGGAVHLPPESGLSNICQMWDRSGWLCHEANRQTRWTVGLSSSPFCCESSFCKAFLQLLQPATLVPISKSFYSWDAWAHVDRSSLRSGALHPSFCYHWFLSYYTVQCPNSRNLWVIKNPVSRKRLFSFNVLKVRG